MAVGYRSSITGFINASENEIIGLLNINCNNYYVLKTQRMAWFTQIKFLKNSLAEIKSQLDERDLDGKIYFEYDIPRMNKRVDVVLLLKGLMFVLEFKNALGEEHTTNGYSVQARDQVMQYALEFSYFYSQSHDCPIIPILIDTNAKKTPENQKLDHPRHNVFPIFCCNREEDFIPFIVATTNNILRFSELKLIESYEKWEQGEYEPTPTIIEVAEAFFNNRSVKEITKSGAGAEGIQNAIDTIEKIILDAKEKSKKVICFLTGVPGAGKTLVGLKLVAKHDVDQKGNNEDRVFLSGNYPLVTVLQNAYINERATEGDFVKEKNKKEDNSYLTDEWKEKQHIAKNKVMITIKQKNGTIKQKKVGYYTKDYSLTLAKAKIQLVKNFRAGYDPGKLTSPHEHIFIFDEAQRAWSLEKVESEEKLYYNKSEPDILLSYLDRHNDWCVAVALVGNGQDIHDGEAGIEEWYNTLKKDEFKDWEIYIAETESTETFNDMKSIHSNNFHSTKELYLDHPMLC